MPGAEAVPQRPAKPSLRRAGNGKIYFTHVRNDILAMIPKGVTRILSVGCGSGNTEAILVKQGISVTGIELDAQAAAEARANGLLMFEGDAANMSAELGSCEFDCIIYADVLEHMTDPVTVMNANVKRLRSGGCVIVSVPNFRHYSVLRQLFLQGHIRYVDAGILDRTHLRITTRRIVEQWFGEVGLREDVVTYRLWRRRERLMAAATFGLLREFLASQVLVRGSVDREDQSEKR